MLILPWGLGTHTHFGEIRLVCINPGSLPFVLFNQGNPTLTIKGTYEIMAVKDTGNSSLGQVSDFRHMCDLARAVSCPSVFLHRKEIIFTQVGE